MALAQQLQLPVVDIHPVEVDEHRFAFVLMYTKYGLIVQQTGPKPSGPVMVDFLAASASHRRRYGGGELIVKAMGISAQHQPWVVDATAGMGQDSFVLASRGYTVTALERSEVVASLLADGLSRAASSSQEPAVTQAIARITLQNVDALEYLHKLASNEQPDVVYIDPMFPPSQKSALVNKQMRAFHHIVGADQDSARLLEVALSAAKYRVVVKRPKKAAAIAGQAPAFCVSGKAIRFDVYPLRSVRK